jgi:hypothetical protein
LAARITGTRARYARGRPLTEAEEAEALASITELAAGRTDLLAQVAGLTWVRAWLSSSAMHGVISTSIRANGPA